MATKVQLDWAQTLQHTKNTPAALALANTTNAQSMAGEANLKCKLP